MALDHRLSAGIGLWAQPLVRPGWTNESLGAPGEKNSPERNHTSAAAGSGETIALWDSAITGYRWFTAWIRLSTLWNCHAVALSRKNYSCTFNFSFQSNIYLKQSEERDHCFKTI